MKKFLLPALSFSLLSLNIVAQTLESQVENQTQEQTQEQEAKNTAHEMQLKKMIASDQALIAPYLKNQSPSRQNNNSSQNSLKFLNNFYFKAEIGGARLNKTQDKLIGKKLSSNSISFVNAGAGFYIFENSRIELDIGLVNNLKYKGSSNGNSSKVGGNLITNVFFNPELTKVSDALSSSNIQQITNLPANGADALLSLIQNSITQFQSNQNTDLTIRQLISQNIIQTVGNNNAAAVENMMSTVINSLVNNPNTRNLYSLLSPEEASIKTSVNIARKVNVIPIMASIYMDIFDFYKVKFFVGGSVGISRIKEKISVNSSIDWPNGSQDLFSKSFNNKTKNNFAYSLSIGCSINLTDKIHTDIKYSFKDFGRTKSKIVENLNLPGVKYQAHTIGAGLRFDL